MSWYSVQAFGPRQPLPTGSRCNGCESCNTEEVARHSQYDPQPDGAAPKGQLDTSREGYARVDSTNGAQSRRGHKHSDSNVRVFCFPSHATQLGPCREQVESSSADGRRGGSRGRGDSPFTRWERPRRPRQRVSPTRVREGGLLTGLALSCYPLTDILETCISVVPLFGGDIHGHVL